MIRRNRSIDEIIDGDYSLAPNSTILVKSTHRGLKKLSESLSIDLRQDSDKVPENNWYEVDSKFSKIIKSNGSFYIGKIPGFDIDSHRYLILPLVYAPNSTPIKGEGRDKNWYVELRN